MERNKGQKTIIFRGGGGASPGRMASALPVGLRPPLALTNFPNPPVPLPIKRLALPLLIQA